MLTILNCMLHPQLKRLSSRLHHKTPSNKHHKRHTHHSNRSRTSSDQANESLKDETPSDQLKTQEPIPTNLPLNLPPIEGVDVHIVHHNQSHSHPKHSHEGTNTTTKITSTKTDSSMPLDLPMLKTSDSSSVNTLTTQGDSLKATESLLPTQAQSHAVPNTIVKRVSRNSIIRLQSIFSGKTCLLLHFLLYFVLFGSKIRYETLRFYIVFLIIHITHLLFHVIYSNITSY